MRAEKKATLQQKIGRRVRTLRKAQGWKQQALAEMIGDRSHSTISDIENGRRMPSPATLHALAEVFDVSVAYLLGKPDAAPESTPETRALKASIRSELDVARSSLERAVTLFAMFL